MSKRKLDPSIEARDFLIRSCTKDLRMRRVLSLGSESKGIEFTENGGPDTGSCEAGGGKDPITDVEIKDASWDCEREEKGKKSDLIKGLDKDSNFSGAKKTGYRPKGILKKPNGSVWDREDPIQSTPPENIITVDNDAANNCQNTFTKSRAKVVPCSRQKLVQVPGSFSYKRLLPFLMEMDKNEVQASSTEEKAFNPDADSPNSILRQNLDFAEIPAFNTPNSEKHEDITAPIFVSTDAQFMSEIPKSENIQSNSTNCAVEPQPPLDDLQAMEILCSPQLIPSPSVQGTLTFDELASGNVHKRSEIQTLTKIGEIKRDSTEGCKGICMCLDCVLFRTNAERSFEFSKRQLTEADEVVRGLVTEICSLRRVLEKFNGNSSDCSQVYQDELIKASCERASLAEKIATLLTKQMFLDLDAHCKRQEARVEFSDCIDQRIIPSSLETNPREFVELPRSNCSFIIFPI